MKKLKNFIGAAKDTLPPRHMKAIKDNLIMMILILMYDISDI